MFKCNVSADLLQRAAYAMASPKSTRFYLEGVYVEPNPHGPGAILTATDGRILISFLDVEGSCEGSATVKIAPETLKMLRSSKSGAGRVIVENDRLTVESRLGALVHIQAVGATIDMQFPTWRKVVKPALEDVTFGGTFDVLLLDRIAAALSSGKARLITLRPCDKDPETAVYRAYSNLNAQYVAVVLPMRREHAVLSAVPEWMA